VAAPGSPWILNPREIGEANGGQVGGKALALSALARSGFRVPGFCCIAAGAYRAYIDRTGLGARIFFELQRKPFEEMRWEEIWDAALRLRSLFLQTPLPAELEKGLRPELEKLFAGRPVVVRSSGIGEDSGGVSFAGLHESFVNIRGTDEILKHTRLVWASLWSDRALLYRQELGLTIEGSAMPVVVQELVSGERSGVVFSQNPNDPSQSVIEAVYGLNQGLVDGTVEPDRWILDRADGRLLTHHGVVREQRMAPRAGGIVLEAVPVGQRDRPPLEAAEVHDLWETACQAEKVFGSPQDVEWTRPEEALFVLQSRPITTLRGGREGDVRSWYLSLRRSYENLKALRRKVEEEIIPGMEREAEDWSQTPLAEMGDEALAAEIERRVERLRHWNDVYYRDCIPLAHGMRLFGQFYNDHVHPADPYEFIDLLRPDQMAGLERNRALEELAGLIREDGLLRDRLAAGGEALADSLFIQRLTAFRERLAGPALEAGEGEQLGTTAEPLIRFLLALADRDPVQAPPVTPDRNLREKSFLGHFPPERVDMAAGLLDLGRASYRLRDDDNVSLGKLEAQLNRAAAEGKRRLAGQGRISEEDEVDGTELVQGLRDPGFRPRIKETTPASPEKKPQRVKARQLIGQPAGPGIATGRARVVRDPADLFQFQKSEVLVCDAVDPNMTFVVPLAAGIVERRGGMLIHGAIIAREYGIPCVTGVAGAAELIGSGTTVTVDGYLGIVTLGEPGGGLTEGFLEEE
jgi:pyruvate,water dikinase